MRVLTFSPLVAGAGVHAILLRTKAAIGSTGGLRFGFSLRDPRDIPTTRLPRIALQNEI